jgi:hypothetical protein
MQSLGKGGRWPTSAVGYPNEVFIGRLRQISAWLRHDKQAACSLNTQWAFLSKCLFYRERFDEFNP